MSFNVAGSSASVPVIPSSDLPTVEEVRGFNAEELNGFLKRRLNGIDNHIDTLTVQEVDGSTILDLTLEDLNIQIPLGPAKKIVKLIKEIQGEQPVASEQYIKENRDLKYHIFYLELANTRNSASVYRHVRERGDVQLWKIEEDITPLEEAVNDVFNQYRNAPAQGLSEINVNQPFCKNVVSEIVNQVERNDLLVVGDNGGRIEDEVFPDIIIDPVGFYAKLTKNPPDLSKGLGWEVKNNLNDKSKASEGKGQLIKYARAYLSADPPLTSIFYGCLTDGKLWQFVKIQLMLDDVNDLKVKFEESLNYEWSKRTASLIAGLINRYHNDLSMRASGEKKESPNNDETFKSSISSKNLLASFIEEGIDIRLSSGNCIHVQITSHLGTGRECTVFLAQVRDYGIKDAVLK
ncbi:13668_t:CDS:2, partial [Acaulospora colombiana]